MPINPIENEGGELKSMENGSSVNTGLSRWAKTGSTGTELAKESARSEIGECGVVISALTMSSSDSSSGSAAAAAGAAPPPAPESAAAAGVAAAAAYASGFVRYSLIC